MMAILEDWKGFTKTVCIASDHPLPFYQIPLFYGMPFGDEYLDYKDLGNPNSDPYTKTMTFNFVGYKDELKTVALYRQETR